MNTRTARRTITCATCDLAMSREVDPIGSPGLYRRLRGRGFCKCVEPGDRGWGKDWGWKAALRRKKL
jgi:hypothetical protein